MLVVLLAFSGDIRQAQALLRWIARLGKNNCDLLLCCDRDTPFDEVMACQKVALESFTDCHIATNAVAVSTYPAGAYSLFKAACEAVYKRFKTPFLVLESDAIPLRPGWLDQISEMYQNCGSAFMGCIYPGTQNFVGEMFMSGIGVYPGDCFTRLKWSDTPVHWDVHHRQEFTDHAADSKLIHHFFGQLDGGVRFIADSRDPQSPREKHLSWIPPGAVLFHRDKFATLIPLLTKKLFPNERLQEAIKVAIPVHSGDVAHAIHHARWMKQLTAGRKWNYTAVLSFDRATSITEVNLLRNLLTDCFVAVEEFTYPHAPIPGYPSAANWSFQCLAHHMSKGRNPWFWCEADLVVLRADWLDRLQEEYENAGRSWMGPVVAHMLHLQGTSVYPADAAKRMPKAMRSVHQAFDMEMKEETLHDRHDCGHLLHHVWSVLNGQLCPVGGGELPLNATPELLNQIPKSCVATHRWKDRSVIDLLMSGRYVH